MRCLSIERCLTRCNRKRACSRSARTRGSGSQIAGTRSRCESTARTWASMRSVLQASGASPLTFCASATRTSQPSSSSVSRTNRAPVIDSITPRTRPCGPTRSTRWRSPSASGGAAKRSTTSPSSPIKQTSRRLRLRSNPACNMSMGLLDLALRWHAERPTGEALLHGSPKRPAVCVLPRGPCPGSPDRTHGAGQSLQSPDFHAPTLGSFRSQAGESEVQVPRTRPPYPEEFRREAIRLALLGDKPQRQLARDLGISEVTLRNWVKQEKAERGERPGGLSGDEREELKRLRDENAKLRMEREILAKAAVFFAKESDGR